MSDQQTVATNAKALINLAARLERMGYDGDCHAEAEHIALNLLADGYRPIEPPPTPRGPGSSERARAEAKEAAAAAIRAARERRTATATTAKESN